MSNTSITTSKLRNRKSNTALKSTSTKKVNFLKKIQREWNNLLSKIQSVSDEVFMNDEIINEYFEVQSSDDNFDKLMKPNKGYKSPEENFIEKFKNFRSLDKMVENEKKNYH